MITITPQMKRITVARATLLLDQPFFGVLALGLQLQEDPTCETAWTDGQSLGYSPAFVDTLSQDELTAVICHEVMHCACGHPWRRDNRDPEQWNVAADHAINPIIVDAKMKLPGCALLDVAQYGGRSAEWIYDRLPKPQPKPDQSGKQSNDPSAGQNAPQSGQNGPPSNDPNGQQGKSKGSDPSRMGEVRDAPESTDGPTEEDWKQQTRQATKAGRGRMPGSLKEEINEVLRTKQDWRSLLRRYVQEVARNDYSWTRPNVRYIQGGLYLPALHSVQCGKLTIAVDTSGSIDTVLLGQFAGEIQAIADELQPSSIEVIYCDTKVHRSETFAQGDVISMNAVGRGGTAFGPVFDHVAESGEIPACLIYLTDLDGSMPDATPEYPVIWAVYGSSDIAPFGDTVRCD